MSRDRKNHARLTVEGLAFTSNVTDARLSQELSVLLATISCSSTPPGRPPGTSPPSRLRLLGVPVCRLHFHQEEEQRRGP